MNFLKNMKKTKLITLILGIISLVVSFVLTTVLNAPTFKEKALKFNSTYKDKEVTLRATYYEKEDAQYGVLICPGYSCDRQKWRPFSDLFVSNGFSTFVFDYAGQGASNKTIGFDNAKTDAIPEEIDDALEYFHEVSNIDYDHIILMGHSMGGRSILRLLQDYNNPEAVTNVTKKDIKNVILMSPEVNYNENAQASLFAGTSDANEYPWNTFNPDYIKGTNVYLYGSTADDVVKDKDILAIAKHLGANNMPSKGVYVGSETNVNGDKITVGITRGILHSYQMYSPEFATFVNGAIKDITGVASAYRASNILMVYFSWGFGLAGLFLTIYGLNKDHEWKVEEGEEVPTLVDTKKFLLNKLLMWLPGLGFAFLICCLCIVMPFGSPVMNIPYMCFIAGYGVIMLILYLRGKVKGVDGKLPMFKFKCRTNVRNAVICACSSVAICFVVWYVLRGSMYRLIPFNWRIFWVLFATLLMSVGYYISGVESDMLAKANVSKKVRFLYSLIQYVPLFLFVGFYLIIKSYSGVIGQAQNLILMYIFCIPLGEFINNRTGNRLYGALSTAFLFQTLMITSAALIAMF